MNANKINNLYVVLAKTLVFEGAFFILEKCVNFGI